MKKYILFYCTLLCTFGLFAQIPQKMSYQAVIRNSSNALVVSSPIGMRVSILQGSATGTAVYVETHTTSTNANGLVSIQIGGGTIVSGTFSGVNWSTGPFFVKTETDPSGGTNYTIVGTSELLSVPYALFAASGTPGPQGPIGLTGPQGLKGDKGDDGAVGPQGPVGLTGPQGLKGDKGDTGAAGPQGPIGLTGPQGLKGDKGDTGAAGPQGPIGLTGPQGLKGDKGDTGAVGPQGPIGLTGPQGLKGDKGDTGAVGPQGPIGLTGPQGPVGSFPPGTTAGQMMYWNGSAWVAVAPGIRSQTLNYCDGVPTWGSCPPIQPTVTTGAVTAITPTSATFGGSISGIPPLFEILSRGVCWSRSVNPTTSDSIRTLTTNTNPFSINVTGLSDSTFYYVRAFVTTTAGTVYGNQVGFSTSPFTMPTVTTNAVTAILPTSATLGGALTVSTTTFPILSRGVCWSRVSNPTITDSIRTWTTNISPFSVNITGLLDTTLYYVRAFANTTSGVVYGNQVSFSTRSFSIPIVTTNAVTAITQTSATIGGTVTVSSTTFPILSRGVCWSRFANPTITDSIRTWTTNISPFSANITGLTDTTLYYVRAFANTTSGVVYGNQVSFSTRQFPTVAITNAVNTISSGSARLGGSHLTISQSFTVIGKGFCWSTSANPTISDSVRNFSASSGSSFSVYLSSFVPATVYYVRAYVTTNVGTTYGNQVSFVTRNTLVVGDTLQGGKLAYLLQPGDIGYNPNVQKGGIIAANPIFLPGIHGHYRIPFGCDSVDVPGATGTAVGTGRQNTLDLVNGCPAAVTAAKLCNNYVSGGYDDWYLPSKDELGRITYSFMMSHFGSINLISSSEVSSTQIWLGNYWMNPTTIYIATKGVGDQSVFPFRDF